VLNHLIPNYDLEIEHLRELGTSGFFLGFGINLSGADYMQIEYPDAWQRIYEENNYYVADPVVMWVFSRSGSTRWSDINLPDIRKVMARARDYGMAYGAAFSRRSGLRRSFLTVARPDRELTDAEIDLLSTKFDSWVNIIMDRASLTDKELDVLRLLRDGLSQKSISDELGIAETTVKQRAISAMKKLDAKTRTHAVALAVQRRYL